jgi:hypothetical protein
MEMWDSLTPADAEHAKNDLSLRRAAVLHRHTEELGALDNEAAEIDTFVRVAEAFARRFKNRPEPPSSEIGDESAATSAPDAPANEAMPQTGLKVQHSPNFAGLIRRYGSSEHNRQAAG